VKKGEDNRMTDTASKSELEREVAERRKAEEALSESEARFRSVLDNSKDFIYRANLQTGIYEYVSPSVKEVWGIQPKNLLPWTAGHRL